jgi:hypothetical protein
MYYPSCERLLRSYSPRRRRRPQKAHRGILPLSHWQSHIYLPLAQLESSWYPIKPRIDTDKLYLSEIYDKTFHVRNVLMQSALRLALANKS